MSRTIRRKSGFGKNMLKDDLKDWDADYISRIYVDRKSDEGKRRIARYHSDSSRVCHNEPGPAWYRHSVVDVPWRRDAKRQLHRYMRNTEFVVILNSKDPLPYWDGGKLTDDRLKCRETFDHYWKVTSGKLQGEWAMLYNVVPFFRSDVGVRTLRCDVLLYPAAGRCPARVGHYGGKAMTSGAITVGPAQETLVDRQAQRWNGR